MPEPPGDPQPLVGFMSNAEWDALLAEVNELVQQMEALPDGLVKERVFKLLDGVDAIHREALRRLVRLFKEGVLEKVVTDPAIHTMMELYDLLPPSAPASSQPKATFPTIPIRAVRAAPPPAPLRYPHWVPVPTQSDELSTGTVRDINVDDRPLALVRRDDQWFALDAACPVDGASMQGARLNGYTLSCPVHAGCHYDVRNGARIGGGAALACYPVKAEPDGRVLIGIDMEFTANLPSF